jgi:3-hydroxy acid dehydrogenase / malonic semialdehyde reductase
MTDGPILQPGAVALVTGASAGIGTAIAEALVAKDCQVICTARRLDRLKALAGRLGENCHAVELDVADAQATAGLIDSLPQGLRDIDILVNNAGHDVGGRRPFTDGDVEDWASIIDTNVTGLIRVSHAVIPGMVARQRGHVINLGSISGIGPAPECNVYTASKFAVHGLSRNLRLDFAGTGIRVTEIMPGTVRTEFGAARWDGDHERADEFYGSFATVLVPEDIARCAIFALEQPANMIVAEMLVMPTAQG